MVIVILRESVYTILTSSYKEATQVKNAVQFALKLAAGLAVLAAAACCIAAYWDKIMELCDCAKEKLAEKRACCQAEYDDYADWDEE